MPYKLLLIPLAPFLFLWTTFHTTHIQLPTGETLPLHFGNDDLAAALRPWLPPA